MGDWIWLGAAATLCVLFVGALAGYELVQRRRRRETMRRLRCDDEYRGREAVRLNGPTVQLVREPPPRRSPARPSRVARQVARGARVGGEESGGGVTARGGEEAVGGPSE